MDKPKAPLSAYNIFFILERRQILDGAAPLCYPKSLDYIRSILEEHKKEKPRRAHRKSHGKIGFGNLAQVISSRWKTIDAVSLNILANLASTEKKIYRQLLKEWKKANEDSRRNEEATFLPNHQDVDSVQNNWLEPRDRFPMLDIDDKADPNKRSSAYQARGLTVSNISSSSGSVDYGRDVCNDGYNSTQRAVAHYKDAEEPQPGSYISMSETKYKSSCPEGAVESYSSEGVNNELSPCKRIDPESCQQEGAAKYSTLKGLVTLTKDDEDMMYPYPFDAIDSEAIFGPIDPEAMDHLFSDYEEN